ncbi:major facilitator superfamily domain-containing protein [Tricladium varicosporioides]|nr:major facilitator superfamily domain-containing protein [Hymenoscyphus varicosporioides]
MEAMADATIMEKKYDPNVEQSEKEASVEIIKSEAVKEFSNPLNDAEGGCQTIVDFGDENDLENPLNWSSRHKTGLVVLISLMELLASLATIMTAPVAPQILSDFHSQNLYYQTLLVSIWELGEVFGPFIIAPLSELYGRFYVYHAGNCLFILCSVVCALSVNIQMLVAFRFLNGIAVVAVILNPSIVGDLYSIESRGAAMAITGLAPLIGPVTGPIIGGYLGQAAGWRWIFWLIAILSGVCEVLFLFFYRETYKVEILKQKSRKLRQTTGNQDYRSNYDTDAPQKAFRDAFLRPLRMLAFSHVLVILSTYVSLVYGYMYLVMTTITLTFEDTYGFSQGEAGLAFLGFSIGFLFGIVFCHYSLDLWVARRVALGQTQPEQRLPPVAFGGIIIPVGFFIFGWTVQHHVHWIVPIIGTGILGLGLIATTIPAASYLVDAFGIHSASAMAVNLVLRNLGGAFFPLAGPPLYARLGQGWGNSLLGFLALAFVPVPLLLMYYGKKLRFLGKFEVDY